MLPKSHLPIDYPNSLFNILKDYVKPINFSGRMFLNAAHTLERFRDVHFMPEIAVRKGLEQWEEDGSADALTRAERACREILENYVRPELPSETLGELTECVEKRRFEISSASNNLI